VHDDPIQRLRSRGVQVTAQRLAVLEAISETPHSAADAIAEAARSHLGAISRQAVYDTLGLLVDKGLIRRIELPGSPARFEDRVGDNHHHLCCRRCNRVLDVECAAGHAPCLTPVDEAGFEIDEAEVVYWGVCANCQETESVRI